MVGSLQVNLRQAFRNLRRYRLFSSLCVVMLGLGIGVVGIILSVATGVLFKPLPYQAPDELTMIWSSWKGFPKTWVSLPEFLLYREKSEQFQDMAIFGLGTANLTGGQEPERVGSSEISSNYFDVLGVKPAVGRFFSDEDVNKQRKDLVVVSHDLWQRRLGGKQELADLQLEINGQSRMVIGVLPPRFKTPLDYTAENPVKVWFPFPEALGASAIVLPDNGGSHQYFVVGRLKPGASVAQAQTELKGLSDTQTQAGIYPKDWAFKPLVISVVDEVLGALRRGVTVLLGAVGFVLLIVCVNVANLLLAQGDQRSREFVLRTALGADRGRLISQLITESVVLAGLGSALGLAVAYLGLRLLRLVSSNRLPRFDEVSLDGGLAVLVFLIGLSTAALFGLLPAFRASRVDLQQQLKQGGRSAGSGLGKASLLTLAVAGQVALALVLVLGGGLLLRSFWNLTQVNPGFKTEGALTFRLDIDAVREHSAQEIISSVDNLLRDLRVLPGVTAAGAVRLLPLASSIGDWGMAIDGYEAAENERVAADWQLATPGYFEAMGMSILAGRSFDDSDREDFEPVIIISESMAKKYWPGQDPIGRGVRVFGADASPWSSVVGVVADVRHNGLTSQPRDTWYLPHTQFHLSTGFPYSQLNFVVKSQGDPVSLIPSVREAVRKLDPSLPVSNIQTLDQLYDNTVAQPRFTMWFLIAAAGFALLLAVLGVYGMMRYSVARQGRELALRAALGGTPSHISRLVVGKGMAVASIGIVVGLMAAVVFGRLLSSLLFEVAALDWLTYAAVALLLATSAFLASYLPGRKAAAMSPMDVLRNE